MRKNYAFALLCALFSLNFIADLTEHRPLFVFIKFTPMHFAPDGMAWQRIPGVGVQTS